MTITLQASDLASSQFIATTQRGQIQTLTVKHPKATAEVALFGAHILSFQPEGQQDLLWMSEKADFSMTKPIRGGIPVCWPWFGKVDEPAHGFARTSLWSLKTFSEDLNKVHLVLELTDSEATRQIWDHAFNAELHIEVSETLKVSLVSSNTGNSEIAIGGALHTYLNVGDITQTTVSHLGNEYIEKSQQHASNGETAFTEEVDRIYLQPEPITQVEDMAFNRKIAVTNTGNNAVVVWNPWAELSRSMADMADNSYQTMVCVESTVHDRSIHLAANESHILTTQLTVKNSGHKE